MEEAAILTRNMYLDIVEPSLSCAFVYLLPKISFVKAS